MFGLTTAKKEQADTAAIIVAAGTASRMGGIDKQFAVLEEIPVLVRSMLALQACPSIREIIVVTREQAIPLVGQLGADYAVSKLTTVVSGGKTRQESVMKGTACISGSSSYMAIHDGARPLLDPGDAEKCISTARKTGAACLGVPVKDTIKQVNAEGVITATPDRSFLWAAQTPQVFSVSAYRLAAGKAKAAGRDFTDDCQLLEFFGCPVTMVAGSYDNIKITTPEDLVLADGLLRRQREEVR